MIASIAVTTTDMAEVCAVRQARQTEQGGEGLHVSHVIGQEEGVVGVTVCVQRYSS